MYDARAWDRWRRAFPATGLDRDDSPHSVEGEKANFNSFEA